MILMRLVVCSRWFVFLLSIPWKMLATEMEPITRKYSMAWLGKSILMLLCICTKTTSLPYLKSLFPYCLNRFFVFFSRGNCRRFAHWRTWFLKEMTAGTAVNDAILAAHQSNDCRKRFPTCKLKSKQILKAIESLLQHVKFNYN